VGLEVGAAFGRAGRRDCFRGRPGERISGRLVSVACIRHSRYYRCVTRHLIHIEEIQMNAMVVTALVFAVPMLILLAVGLYLGK